MNEEKTIDPVPYYMHEEILARQERNTKRLFVLCIIIFVALIGTNAAWIWYENQFIDEVTITQENDDGYNNYIGNDGDINN